MCAPLLMSVSVVLHRHSCLCAQPSNGARANPGVGKRPLDEARGGSDQMSPACSGRGTTTDDRSRTDTATVGVTVATAAATAA